MVIYVKCERKWKLITQWCPTLCDPMDCSPPGSSVKGILQARILKWVAISFSRGSSWPRNWTQVSCIAGRLFTDRVTGKPKVQCLKLSTQMWQFFSFLWRNLHMQFAGGKQHGFEFTTQLESSWRWWWCCWNEQLGNPKTVKMGAKVLNGKILLRVRRK